MDWNEAVAQRIVARTLLPAIHVADGTPPIEERHHPVVLLFSVLDDEVGSGVVRIDRQAPLPTVSPTIAN